MIVRLIRKSTGTDGTFGDFIGFDFDFLSGELPWKDNAAGKSCIPHGSYKCLWQVSRRFGPCYEVTGVPDRSRILIHSGNFCADKDSGKKSDIEGCILLGKSTGVLSGQKAILRSKEAIREFHERMREQDFELSVEWK